jgi:uncharacterized protein
MQPLERLHDHDLARVAMFPLPDVVLLPGTLLPLHIFEPRYRDMIRDVLAGTGLVALARLVPGYEAEYHGRPAVYPTLGVGRVVASEELDDGRYNILLRGLIRATVAEELPPDRLYRVVRVVPILDVAGEEPALLRAAQQKLVALCDQLAAQLEPGGESLHELARSASAPGRCADMVSAALVTDPEARQRLLESGDPLERLELAIQHISRLVASLDGPDPDSLN